MLHCNIKNSQHIRGLQKKKHLFCQLVWKLPKGITLQPVPLLPAAAVSLSTKGLLTIVTPLVI